MEAQRRVQDRNGNVYVNSVHPGAVDTEFLNEKSVVTFLGDRLGPLLFGIAKRAMRNIAWDSETASLSQLFTAVSARTKGRYYHPIAQTVTPSALATTENAQRLWKETEGIL